MRKKIYELCMVFKDTIGENTEVKSSQDKREPILSLILWVSV